MLFYSNNIQREGARSLDIIKHIRQIKQCLFNNSGRRRRRRRRIWLSHFGSTHAVFTILWDRESGSSSLRRRGLNILVRLRKWTRKKMRKFREIEKCRLTLDCYCCNIMSSSSHFCC